MNITGVVT